MGEFNSRHSDRVVLPPQALVPKDISSEAVTIPAGAAGTVVNFYLTRKPILDSNKSWFGGNGDTSLSFTSTTFDVEVSPTTVDADLSNGEYWVDYLTGKGRGKKKDTGTSASMSYSVFESPLVVDDINVDTTSVSTTGLVGKSSGGEFTTAYASGTTIDCTNLPSYHAALLDDDLVTIVQINTSGTVVETYSRDDTTMTVATNTITVTGATFAASDAFVVYTNINQRADSEHTEDVAHVTADAGTQILAVRNDTLASLVSDDGDYAPLQVNASGALFTQVAGGSAYENASYAETEAIATVSEFTTAGIYGLDADVGGGATLRAVQVAVDNATVSATPNVLIGGGIYKAALDTYDDNDASPLHMNVNGELLVALSSDIEIGAVEIKDGTTDARQAVKVDNATASATPTLAVTGGIYKATLDTYDDNDATPLHFNVNGALLTNLHDGTTPLDIGLDESAMAATPGFVPVGGEYRSGDTTYTDGDASVLQTDVNGYVKVRGKNYDAATTANKGFEVNPISQHHIEENPALTNVANATPQYVYLDMDGYRNFGFQWIASGGGDTVVVTVEATLQDDGTAAASCTYVDVTTDWFGVASWTADDLIQADETIVAKYVRVKFTTAGGGNDEDFTTYVKRLY